MEGEEKELFIARGGIHSSFVTRFDGHGEIRLIARMVFMLLTRGISPSKVDCCVLPTTVAALQLSMNG